MGGHYLKIIRETDFNRDGFPDRLTARCRKEDGKEICRDYQIEMGLREGGFIQVFKAPSGLPEKFNPKARWFFSPHHYANMPPVLGLIPGREAPFEVRKARPRAEFLTTGELIQICSKKILLNKEQRESCKRQARKAQRDHIYQPEAALYPDDQKSLYHRKKGGIWLPISFEEVVQAESVRTDLYAPPEFGDQLKANIFSRVRNRESHSLPEYVYAYEQKAVTAKFVAKTILSGWDRFELGLLKSEKARKVVLEVCKKDEGLRKDFQRRLEGGTSRGGFVGELTLSLLYDLNPKKTKETLKQILRDPHTDTALRTKAMAVALKKAPEILKPENVMRGIQNGRRFVTSTNSPNTPLLWGTLVWDSPLVRNYLMRLERFQTLPPKFLFELADIFNGGRIPPKNHIITNLAFPPQYYVKIGEILHKQLSDPKNLIPLAKYLAENFPEDGLKGGKWTDRLMAQYPFKKVGGGKKTLYQTRRLWTSLLGLLTTTRDPRKVPSGKVLLRLAEKMDHPSLQGAVLVAAAHRGERDPQFLFLARNLSKAPDKKVRLSVIYALPRLIGNRALPQIVALTRDKEQEVRLAAFGTLFRLGVKDQKVFQDSSVQQAFRNGFRDSFIGIRILSAHILLALGDQGTRRALFVELRDYVASQHFRERSMEGVSPLLRTRKPAKSREVAMEMPIYHLDAQGKKGPPITLKLLALQTLPQGGDSLTALPVLKKVFAVEKDELSLLIAAQNLYQILGPKGAFPIVMARIVNQSSTPVPPSLYRYAVFLVAKGNIQKADRLLYQFLFHFHPTVRHDAVLVLQRFHKKDGKLLVGALLRESHHTQNFIRARAAEALAYFWEDLRVKERLKELISDPDKDVQKLAKVLLKKVRAARETSASSS